MDVSGEAVVATKRARDADHLLHRLVRRPRHPGRQEQPLDIVALVELDRQRHDLLDAEPRAGGVRRATVDAIGAVVEAPVGQQDFQQRHAAPVRRVGVADAGAGGRAEPFRPAPASSARPTTRRRRHTSRRRRGCAAWRRDGGPSPMFTMRSRPAQAHACTSGDHGCMSVRRSTAGGHAPTGLSPAGRSRPRRA